MATRTYAPATQTAVYRALKRLGRTSDEIAQTFRSAVVTGVRCQASQCPVANYLRDRFGCSFLVESENIYWDDQDCDTPGPVSMFVDRFDERFYPDLVQPVRDASPSG
jgi:hypothetical protein